jgi:dienelactone hydrolase
MDLIRRGGRFEELDEAQRKVRGRPWFEYVHLCDRARFDSGKLMVGFDPGTCWEKVYCPVLAVFGEKDTSCPVERSVAILRRGLDRAGNRDVTVKTFPRADHALTVSETGGRKEPRRRARQRGKVAEPEFVPGYPELMADWLAERFGPRD